MMAYWIGGVLAILIFCPIAYKLGKKDGAQEAMERVYEAHTPEDIYYQLLDDKLRKRIEAL